MVGALLVLVVSLLVFVATNLLPGDPAGAILGRSATPAAVAELRSELHLDEPLPTRYWHWLTRTAQGDAGRSYATREPVSSLIADRAWNSGALALVTIALMIPLSLILGVAAALRAGRTTDHVISVLSLGAIAVPEFVTGTLLAAVFAVSLNLLPPVSLLAPGEDPFAHLDLLALPVATLLVTGATYNIRMVRAGMIDVLASEYVRGARLNGVPERRVIWKHALRNALTPAIQMLALTTQWLVGGVVVVESVFSYPGIGQGLVSAVSARDLPVVQALTLYIAVIYIAINIAADLAVILILPKLRTSV